MKMLAINTFIPNIFLILLVTLPITYTTVIEKYNFAMHYFKNFSNAVLFTGFFEDFQMFFFVLGFLGFSWHKCVDYLDFLVKCRVKTCGWTRTWIWTWTWTWTWT